MRSCGEPLTVMVRFTDSPGRRVKFRGVTVIVALSGAVADAFLAAFQLVNVVRRLLSEGALNAALIPAWLRVRDRDGEAAASAFAGRVLGTVSAALIAGRFAMYGTCKSSVPFSASTGTCTFRSVGPGS